MHKAKYVLFMLIAAMGIQPNTIFACEGYLSISPGSFLVLCPGDSLTLHVETFMIDPPFNWSTGETSDSIVITSPGNYWVMGASGCGYSMTTVIELDSASMAAELSYTFCPGGNVVADAGFFNGSFIWEDGNTSHPRVFSQPGDHFLTCSLPCGTFVKTIHIVEFDTAAVMLPAQYLCEGDTIVLAHQGNPTYFQWGNGATTPTLVVTAPGYYISETFTPCHHSYIYPVYDDPECNLICKPMLPGFFSPNDDGINDWLVEYSPCEFNGWDFRVYDRLGRIVFTSSREMTGWNGTIREGNASEGVYFWTVKYDNGSHSDWISGSVLLMR